MRLEIQRLCQSSTTTIAALILREYMISNGEQVDLTCCIYCRSKATEFKCLILKILQPVNKNKLIS
jgi:hypothetical protein